MIRLTVLILESTTVPVPMTYAQIADDLQARVAAGEYAPGARLPTYIELAELYSVSRRTAARAYGMLVDRGVVVGSTGRGMYVRFRDE